MQHTAFKHRHTGIAGSQQLHLHRCKCHQTADSACSLPCLYQGACRAPHGELTYDQEACAWILAVLDVLVWMHKLGLVHRDIKPHNILLDAAFRAYVADFGLARSKEAMELHNTNVDGGTIH